MRTRRWRWIATNAVAAAIMFGSAAGCAGRDSGATGTNATPTTGAPGSTSDAPGSPATTIDAAGGGATPAPSAQDTVVATTSASGGLFSPGLPGSFAGRYLRPSESNRITLVALVQSGAEPQPGTLEHLQQVLQQASGKPVELRTITLDSAAQSWTSESLATLIDRSAPAQTADTAVVSMLFVHGDYNGDASVLGVATRGDFAAVFVDQLSGSAGLLGSVGPIEKAASTHEVGHLLGLVDLVLHTGRQDPDHPGHSRNQASVMYWAVESNVISQVLGANPPTEFDAADEADLATIRSN